MMSHYLIKTRKLVIDGNFSNHAVVATGKAPGTSNKYPVESATYCHTAVNVFSTITALHKRKL